jgi:hypothetical protein
MHVVSSVPLSTTNQLAYLYLTIRVMAELAQVRSLIDKIKWIMVEGVGGVGQETT